MIKIDRAVIVEGKYDKIKLSSLIDAVIIETEGFGIFKDRQKQKLIRALAEKNGIIVMTDSDSAGFVIRSFLSSIVSPDRITHVYIPDILGKEKRKDSPSKEGKLGVEGMSAEIISDALKKAGITSTSINEPAAKVTKTDFYNDSISGKSNSLKRRKALLKRLDLPENLSANGLLKIINAYMTYDDYKRAVEEINSEEKL